MAPWPAPRWRAHTWGTCRRGSSTSASRTWSIPRTTASASSHGSQAAGYGVADDAGDQSARLEQPAQVDAARVPHAVQDVHELFGGEVPGPALAKRRPAEPADRR